MSEKLDKTSVSMLHLLVLTVKQFELGLKSHYLTLESNLSAAPAIVSPTEYEEQLKESKDLFTKSKSVKSRRFLTCIEKNRVLRHLNRTVAKYNNSKRKNSS